jgi:hypothetical protein
MQGLPIQQVTIYAKCAVGIFSHELRLAACEVQHAPGETKKQKHLVAHEERAFAVGDKQTVIADMLLDPSC